MKHMKVLSGVSTAVLGRISGRHRCQVLLVDGCRDSRQDTHDTRGCHRDIYDLSPVDERLVV